MVNSLQRQCQGVTYLIQPGDTFYSIANRYNVSVQELIKSNPQITNPNFLYIGQQVCIPITCSGRFYTIQSGESLNMISRKFGVSLAQLLAANPQINNPNVLYVGQRICIPTRTVIQKGCSIVLSQSADTENAVPNAGGVVLIQLIEGEQHRITFAASGLPEPESIGDFTAYVGSLIVKGQRYSAILSQSAPLEQEPTWAGSRIVDVNPFSLPINEVSIAPINIEEEVQSAPIMEGIVVQCR